MRRMAVELLQDEGGHAVPALADLVAAIGAVILVVGAATGEDVVTILGGIMLAVGILSSGLLRHLQIDYDIYERLERLENPSSDDD